MKASFFCNFAIFRNYAIISVAIFVAYFFLPDIPVLLTCWQLAVGWSVAAIIVAAVRINKLQAAMGWYFCAAGIFLNTTGIGVDFICMHYFGFTMRDYPRPADVFWLSIYPSVAIGISILAHRPGKSQDWASIIDSAIIITDLSLLAWIFAISESTQQIHTATALLFVIAYPVGDLVLLGVLIRMLLQGKGNASVRLIVISLILFLCGDLGWALAVKLNSIPDGLKFRTLQTLFLMAFLCFGAAALRQKKQEITSPEDIRSASVSQTLLIILALTSLIPPALLFHQALSGHVENGVAISIGSGVLFLLVITRVVGLLHKVELQTVQLNALSRTDELTGLFNRRAWMEELNGAIERARRNKNPLVIALLDLDRFKTFNDKFGHLAGDELLKGAAKAWLKEIRVPDVLGRYGGEEFILILPNTNLHSGEFILERLRPMMPANQTFSAGLALWNGEETAERLLMRADVALYQAKEQGRNRTILA